jgi:hypothetical protein
MVGLRQRETRRDRVERERGEREEREGGKGEGKKRHPPTLPTYLLTYLPTYLQDTGDMPTFQVDFETDADFLRDSNF